jgi:hypothetical protein
MKEELLLRAGSGIKSGTFLKPDPDSKLYRNSDSDPQKIVSDTQY